MSFPLLDVINKHVRHGSEKKNGYVEALEQKLEEKSFFLESRHGDAFEGNMYYLAYELLSNPNYKDYKDAYMVCLRALFGDVLTLDEETFVLLDASFALVENDGDYICSKGFERWLQVQLPYIYGAFLSREDFTKNVYDVMYHFVATGKESALEN